MQKPFEIGLVMAGASSAGAYTAGLLNFIIQPMDAWQNAKNKGNPKASQHEVRLIVTVGSPASGLTAGIGCAELALDFQPITVLYKPDPANNLFDGRVKPFDTAKLLGLADLPSKSLPKHSLLDCMAGWHIKDTNRFETRNERHSWVINNPSQTPLVLTPLVLYDDALIETLAQTMPPARRLMHLAGIGPITATALVASVGDAKAFASGRQFAAWLGLTPRQYSSGGKSRLGSISKRGDGYLKRMLVHGARSVLRVVKDKTDRLGRWAEAVRQRRGKSVVAVALAAKHARIVWALLAKGEAYCPAQ